MNGNIHIYLHKFANIDGVRIHYVEKGAGDPIILIHGLGAYSYTWRKNWDALARHFRVLAVDLKGFGFSDKPKRNGYSIDSHVALVEKFIDRLDLKTADIIGSSMGGEIGLRLALKSPDKVRRLILVAPSCYRDRPPGYARWICRLPYMSLFRHYIRRLFMNPEALLATVKGACYNTNLITEAEVRNYLLPVYLDGFDRAFIQMLREFDFGKERSRYNQITHQTLIVAGDKDRIIPYFHLERLQKELKNAALITLKDTGHFPHEERYDVANQLFINFLLEKREPLYSV